MSKTVDERVVEMRFDNEQFERNAGKSISTLAKLKQALKLSGASDGLDNISKSAKNVDLSNIASGVENLAKRFSTLGIVGMRILQNLTDKMMSLGGRAVSFFTNGIVQGGITRATNLENAHFQLQGLLKDEAAVQAVMQNVKDSVDGTAYSLDAAAKVASQLAASGMTAGDNMYKSLRAVAGVAAMTNSEYESIGQIFTTVAGNGRLMGDQLLQLSSRGMNAAATLADYLGKTESEVREMVSDGKISFQTFADAMDDAFGEHAKKANETFSGSMANVKSALGRIGADFVAPLIEQNGPLVQFFNTLRERVNELHNSLGPLTEKVTDFATKAIGSATEALKNFSPSMDSKWNKFVEQINNAGIETETFQEKLKECAKSHNVNLDEMIEKEGSFGKAVTEAFRNGDLNKSVISETLRSIAGEITETTTAAGTMAEKIDEYGDVVNQVINGKFGNAPERFERLTEAGYDYALVQNLVNEQLKSGVENVSELSDEQLKNCGFTDKQVSSIKELADAAEDADSSVSELIDGLNKPSAVSLLFDTLQNVFSGLVKSFRSIGGAWKEIFGDGSTANQLYGLVDALNRLSEHFVISDEKADKLKRTFKGLFAILDIAKTVLLELGKTIFSSLSSAFGNIDLDILGFTANIGDALVKFRNRVMESGTIAEVFEKISSTVEKTTEKIGDALSNLFHRTKDSDHTFSNFGNTISKIGEKIKLVFGWLKENISAGDIFAGLTGVGIFALFTSLAGAIGKLKKIFGNFSGILKTIKKTIGEKGIFKLIFGEKDDSENILSKFKDILGGVHDALEAFTNGVKIASLIGIAVAIGILSSSLKTISKLDTYDLTTSLGAIGIMFGMLTSTLKSMSKTLSKFESKGLIKAATALILMAVAIKIFAGALIKMSELSFSEIVRGLVGLGGGLLELTGALKLIGNTKISLKTSVAIVVLAKSCETLANALRAFGSMQWDEIGRGLTAMGGALGELVASVSVLGKFGGGKSFLSSIGIAIIIQSLDELAASLEIFGMMAWDEIGRGLTAMGGALGELVASLGVLNKLGAFKSIFSSLGIVIIIQSLDELAYVLQIFGMMAWDEIGRGLTAMGGALGELVASLGVLNKLGSFKSLFASIDIYVVSQSLDEIADVLCQLGQLQWDEIGRGLTAMGGALGEVGLVSGLLGKLVGFSGLIGSTAIVNTVRSLSDLASAFGTFGQMDWGMIAHGLAGMGGALGEVAIVTGLLGKLGGLSALLGGSALYLAIQSLGELADAFVIFAEIDTWEDIVQGLVGMGGALSEVAVISGLLGNLGGFGALLGGLSLKLSIESLGELADAFKKFADMDWEDVKSGLVAMGAALGEIAVGGLANTLSILGSISIANVAEPLGALAESVKKWVGVKVPDGLGDQLRALAPGIRAFTFSGLGANALSSAAEPLGILADSVKRWTEVKIPDGLAEQLMKVAAGVNSFSFAWVAGKSLSSAAEPLGMLADSVAKWSALSIPDNLSETLIDLAEGIGSFGLGEWLSGFSLKNVCDALNTLSGSLEKFSSTNLDSGVAVRIRSISDSITSLASTDTGGLYNASAAISDIRTSLEKLADVDVSSLASDLSSVISSINNMDMPINLGTDIIKSIAEGINSGKPKVTTAVKSVLDSVINSIKAKYSTLKNCGITMMSNVISGMNNKRSAVSSAASQTASKAVTAIRSNYANFKTAGAYLGSGLVVGINSKKQAVYNAGYALGQKAVQGEKDGQKSKSPSKLTIQAGKWLGEGLVIGIWKMVSKAYDAGKTLGTTTSDAVASSLSGIAAMMDGNIDMQPTIRPVLDLGNVSSGIDSINSMLNLTPSLGLMSSIGNIDSAMNERNQNGTNADVISAIKGLSKQLGKTGNTYNSINGVTYDDGSNVSNAIETLVRAANVERRR